MKTTTIINHHLPGAQNLKPSGIIQGKGSGLGNGLQTILTITKICAIFAFTENTSVNRELDKPTDLG